MKTNPRYAHFVKVLEKRSRDWLKPWEGDCWRFQSVEFPSADEILSGEGAFRNGGRWNAIHSFRAIYGSADDVTATRESAALAKYYGFPSREPRLLVCIHSKLSHILDLTDGMIRRSLGITLKEIEAEDWRKLQDAGNESLSQALGRAAREQGAEGLLARSFANRRGVNIVVFPSDLAEKSRLYLWDKDKLDKLRKSR